MTRNFTAKTKDIFEGLVLNGIEFIKRSLDKNEIQNFPRDSLIKFVSGIELILKARLLHEHWSLIYVHPDKCNYDEFLKGEFRSIGIDEAIKRLNNIDDTILSGYKLDHIAYLQKVRNKLIHFYDKAYITTGTTKPDQNKIEEIVILQLDTWFVVEKYLFNNWQDIFSALISNLYEISTLIKENTKLLNKKFQLIEENLKKLEKEGIIIFTCPSCDYTSCSSSNIAKKIPFVDMANCLLCKWSYWRLFLECSDCAEKVIYDGTGPDISCKCGTKEIDDYLDRSDFKFEKIICGYCFTPNRSIIENQSHLCLNCLEESKYIIDCASCTNQYATNIQDFSCIKCE